MGEMLVVLAVFSILAIMFFFSSNTAIVKTKLSRVMQEEKFLARALQSYEGDYLDVPTQLQGLSRLKSPVAYLSKIPTDPFNKAAKDTREYGYISDLSPNHRWIIVSVGPDGESDIQNAIDEINQGKDVKQSNSPWPYRASLMTPAEAKEFISRYSYDPTNGSISKGDIIVSYGE